MANEFCTVCPTTCAEVLLPALGDNCRPVASRSQVNEILIKVESATGPEDWAVAGDWVAVIDNTDILNAKVKRLTVEGEIPAPEKSEVKFGNRKVVVGERAYTLTVKTRDLPDATRNLAKALQCGDIRINFWYTTLGGKMFGGQDGISPYMVDADLPLGGGDDDYEEAVFTFKFRACGDPPRIVNPLA